MNRRKFLAGSLGVFLGSLLPTLKKQGVGIFKPTGSATYWFDGEIVAAGEVLDLDSLSIVAGDTVTLKGFTITIPREEVIND